jgi:hypothetical protein
MAALVRNFYINPDVYPVGGIVLFVSTRDG